MVDFLRYAVRPRRHADIFVLAHTDRGANQLSDAPYIGKLADRLRSKHSLLFFQMQPLARTRNVVAYPWLAMRIIELTFGRLGLGVSETDRALARDLAAQYRISPKLVERRIGRLNFELRHWRRMLERYRPRRILLVDGYSSNAALIWVARRMGIVTLEVQHGACGGSHIGYRGIGASPEPLSPDYFLAWNSFWADRMREVPGYTSKIKVCPMTAQILPGRDRESAETKGVLLIHQPVASQILLDLISGLPDRADRSQVAVKFHPGIQAHWEEAIETMCARKGVAVLRNRPIDEVIGDYDRVVGWFSTVLSQAATAGYTANYLPQEGFEAQQSVVEQAGVRRLTLEEFMAMAKL